MVFYLESLWFTQSPSSFWHQRNHNFQANTPPLYLLKLQSYFLFVIPTFQSVSSLFTNSSPLVLTQYHSSPSGGDYTSVGNDRFCCVILGFCGSVWLFSPTHLNSDLLHCPLLIFLSIFFFSYLLCCLFFTNNWLDICPVLVQLNSTVKIVRLGVCKLIHWLCLSSEQQGILAQIPLVALPYVLCISHP